MNRELRITEADIEKYLEKPLTGGAFGHSRTGKEIEKDFKIIHILRIKGHSFEEITDYLNSERPYITSVDANRKMYFRKIDTIELFKDNEEEVRLHKKMMIDNLDHVIREALKAWQRSMESDEVIERQGYVKTIKEKLKDLEEGSIYSPQMLDELKTDFEETLGEMDISKYTHPISSHISKEFITITTDKGRADKARFLDIILKAENQKAKILGLITEKADKVDIVNVLNQIIIQDSPREDVAKPITNELEAANMFDETQELMIQERYAEYEEE